MEISIYDILKWALGTVILLLCYTFTQLISRIKKLEDESLKKEYAELRVAEIKAEIEVVLKTVKEQGMRMDMLMEQSHTLITKLIDKLTNKKSN